MDEKRLERIVQLMIDNNEPEDKIMEVVRQARQMMQAVPSREEVVESVESGETQAGPAINIEELKRVSEAIKKRTNGNEDFQMNEDQLNSPIGQDGS